MGPVVEEVESRRMRAVTVSTSTYDMITDVSGVYYASVLFGDNGYVDGYPTAGAGNGDNIQAVSYATWSLDPYDGFDTGLVGFGYCLNDNGSGSASIEVSNAGPATYYAGTPGGVHQVTIQAAVSGGSLLMSWERLTVLFYRNGQLVEEVRVPDVRADTLGAANSGPIQSIATITARNENYDGVYVAGCVRLAAGEGMYPGATDIFGKITIS
jgi:hypothetical protein